MDENGGKLLVELLKLLCSNSDRLLSPVKKALRAVSKIGSKAYLGVRLTSTSTGTVLVPVVYSTSYCMEIHTVLVQYSGTCFYTCCRGVLRLQQTRRFTVVPFVG